MRDVFPPPPPGFLGRSGGRRDLLWNPSQLGATADAHLSSKVFEHLDHLIAGCVTTAAKFPPFQPTQLATRPQCGGRPHSDGQFHSNPLTWSGLVGVAVTLWQKCPRSSLGRNLRSKTR